jgi:hypothetical protein
VAPKVKPPANAAPLLGNPLRSGRFVDQLVSRPVNPVSITSGTATPDYAFKLKTSARTPSPLTPSMRALSGES